MGNSNRSNKSIHNCLLVIVVVVAELILLQKSPAPQSHPLLHLHPWNFAVLHWYPNGISSMGLQQFFIGILNNFHNQKKELH